MVTRGGASVIYVDTLMHKILINGRTQTQPQMLIMPQNYLIFLSSSLRSEIVVVVLGMGLVMG